MLRSLHDIKGIQRKMGLFLVRMRGLATWARVPRFLQIEPTNDCNIACRQCPNNGRGREKGYMSFALFCRIIDEAADIRVRRIHLYLRGEPLLHRRIGDMVRHLKSRDLAVTLATNGMLMDRQKVSEFMNAGMTDDDYVQLPASGRAERLQVRAPQGPASISAGSNIADLLEYRAARMMSAPPPTAKHGGTRRRRVEEEDRGERPHTPSCYASADEPAGTCPTRIWQARDVTARPSADPGQRSGQPGRCRQPWEKMTVLWNGDVALCAVDTDGRYVLGSLRRQSIMEIWNGEQLSVIRGLHRRSDFRTLPICAVCGR